MMSTLNGNAGSVQITGLDVYHNRTEHRESLLHSTTFEGRANSSVRDILSPNDKLASFTQINCVAPERFHPVDEDTGTSL